MKKGLIIVCAAACMAAALAPVWSQGAAPQVTSPLTTTVNLGYSSQYVWRGLQINDDPVVQPSITIANKNGLSLNFNGVLNTKTNFDGRSGDFSRVDYGLNYGWTKNKLGYNAGLVTYTYPNGGRSGPTYDEGAYALGFDDSTATTNEIYLSTTLPVMFAPTVAVNYDFNEVIGLYATVGAAHKLPLGFKKVPQMNLTAKIGYATAGYNEYYFNINKAAFTDAAVSASFPIQISNMVTIAPTATYTTVIDSLLKSRAEFDRRKATNFFVGVNTSFSF